MSSSTCELDNKWECVDGPKHFVELKDVFHNTDDGADQWFDQKLQEGFAESFFNTLSQNGATTSSESKEVDNSEEFPKTRETFVVQKSILGYSPRPQPVQRKPLRDGSPELTHEVRQAKQDPTKDGDNLESSPEALPVAKSKPGRKSAGVEKATKSVADKAVPVIKRPSTFKSQNKLVSQRSAALKAVGTIKSILSPKKNPVKKHKTTSSDVKKTASTSKLAEERKTTSTEKKTYEEIQLEEAKRLQTETRRKLRANRQSYAKLSRRSAPVAPVKGSMPTTEPMEFKFHQTAREKKGVVVKSDSQGVNEHHFMKSLRSSRRSDNYNPNMSSTKPPTPTGTTKFKPFKFHLDDRLSNKQPAPTLEAGPQIPIAEFVAKFEKATPPRFRRSKKSQERSVCKASHLAPLTDPKSPNLTTSKRSRPVTVKSAAMLEEEELEEIKKHKFTATTLNPAIFKKEGLMGVPRKIKKPLIPPATPELMTRKRFRERAEKEVEEKEKENSAFHAKPMPDFSKITGIPPKKEFSITDPESPALSLKRRRIHDDSDVTLNESKKPKNEEPQFEFKATAAPNLDNAFRPKLEGKNTFTVPEPFSFEGRDKDKPSRQSFVEMILSKEKPAPFKANALRDMSEPRGLPEKVTQPSTKPEPFQLLSIARSEENSRKLKEKQVADENASLRTHFTATDASVLYERPFMPQPSAKPTTQPDDFVLRSQVRSEKRAQFEDHLKAETQRKEEESLKRKTLREIQEKRELTKYRKSLVHKAQPIKNYSNVVIQTNKIEPTVPISPHFHTDSRLRTS